MNVIGTIHLLVGLCLLLIPAVVLLTRLRLRGMLSNLLGLPIIAYALLILLTLILSELHLINPYMFLLGQFVIAAIILWFNRKSIFRWLGTRNIWAELVRKIPKASPFDLVLLGLAVGITFLIGIYLIIIVPPNTNDSYLYHLSRVAHWLQRGSLRHFYVADELKLVHPVNTEISFLWLIALWGTDGLTGFVQWMATLLTMAAIYGITQHLNFSRAAGLFAALIWSSFPIVVAQSTSTKNDILAAFFVMSSFYFLIAGLRATDEMYRPNFALSGLALGLAIGTKSLAFLALPGMGLLAVWMLLSKPKIWASKWVFFAGCCLVSVILLGSYNYLLNFLDYGSPFGPPEIGDEHTMRDPTLVSFVSILARLLYQLADPTGLPEPVIDFIQQGRVPLGEHLFAWLTIDPNLPHSSWHEATFDFADGRQFVSRDGVSWYGPLAFLLLVPLTLYYLIVAPLTRPNLWRTFIALSAVAFIASFALLIRWQPYAGRYIMIGVSLASPLMAAFYETFSDKFKVLRWAVVGLAIWILGWSAVHNYHRPLLADPPVAERDYYELRSIEKPYMAAAYRYLDNTLPETSRLGINGEWLITNWDYLFFGPELKRHVVYVDLSSGRIDLDTFEKQNIDYLLISAEVAEEVQTETPLWPVIANDKAEWYLAKRSEAALFAASADKDQVYAERFGDDYRAYLQIQSHLNQMETPLRILSTDPRMSFYTNDNRWEFRMLSDFTELGNYTHLVVAPWWTAADYERIGFSYETLNDFLQKEEFVKETFESNGYKVYQLQF